jgi:hypothetical protein
MLEKVNFARKYGQNRYFKDAAAILNSQAVTGVRGSMDWASKIADRLVGQDFVTGRNTTESVVIHDSEFCGKTRGVGSTSTVVDITEVIL